jgi:hypothetical protein
MSNHLLIALDSGEIDSPMLRRLFPPCHLPALLIVSLASCAPVMAGEAYFTGFESPPFTAGDDTIIGTDSWLGSHAGMKLHGVMSEAAHGVAGIGNAAFIGGYATTITSTSKSVYVRRPVNLDPLALNQEVATFSVVFGIMDSSSTKRDNFEFLIYNNQTPSPELLAGVQLDNTTLDTSVTPNIPRRLIYRLSWNATSGKYEYLLTGYTFLPERLETLQFRINYRTNLWTATLSNVPIFQDVTFYTGTASKNLGSVMVKMGVTNSTTTTILPGDNYLLFDDYTLRTDALATTLTVSKTDTGAASLTWNEEAGYTYQVEHSSDSKAWQTNLPGSSHKAALTGPATFTDPTTPISSKHFYRLKRSYP